MYLRPASLSDALVALAETGGTVLSGGTDLFPPLSDRPLGGTVIDISGLSEIRGVRIGKEHVHIGGRTTWTDVTKAQLPRGFDGLKQAAREIGSVQIQNTATVAGNICNASPAADGVAALMALDAELTLASRNGTRTLPLHQFVLGNRRTGRRPDELLTEVRVPRRLEDAASTFLKLGARRYLVISIVMIAANLVADDDGRIREALVCAGSCSPVAQRLLDLERDLAGLHIADLLRGNFVKPTHLACLAPIDDVRATAAYRRDAARILTERALRACAEKLL
ncbi:MAG TPA: FAD binding domain-containing protein [Candidatus Acidoferrum sp.]